MQLTSSYWHWQAYAIPPQFRTWEPTLEFVNRTNLVELDPQRVAIGVLHIQETPRWGTLNVFRRAVKYPPMIFDPQATLMSPRKHPDIQKEMPRFVPVKPDYRHITVLKYRADFVKEHATSDR